MDESEEFLNLNGGGIQNFHEASWTSKFGKEFWCLFPFILLCVRARFFYNHKRQPSWQMATLDMKVHLQLRHSCTDRWMRTKVGHIFKVKLAINSIAAL